MALLTNITHVIKETGPKVGCFALFCHYCLVTMSVHTHTYHYPLFESGMKTGLCVIALCRKNIASTIT